MEVCSEVLGMSAENPKTHAFTTLALSHPTEKIQYPVTSWAFGGLRSPW